MAGSCLVNMACLNIRKNSKGIVSREENGEDMVQLGEVPMGSPTPKAGTHVCSERKCDGIPGSIPSLFASLQIWRNPGNWKEMQCLEDELTPPVERLNASNNCTDDNELESCSSFTWK